MSKSPDKSDRTLARRQDEVDFRKIVDAHSKMLYTHIRSILLNHDDTDDVLQNTFIKAWQNLGNFRGDSDLQTWLFRIATNEALQQLRKQRIRKLFFVSEKSAANEPVTYGHVMNDCEDIKRRLEESMQMLTAKQRMVFGMKYFNQMKYNEMATILKLSEGTLKAVYHTAVTKIEKFIIANT